MRPLLSLTSSLGITEWIVCSSQTRDADAARQLQQVEKLRAWAIPSPAWASSFALGRLRMGASVAMLTEAPQLVDLLPLLRELSCQKRALLLFVVGEQVDSCSLDDVPCRVLPLAELDESSLVEPLQQGEPVVSFVSEAQFSEMLEAGFPNKIRPAAPLPAAPFRGSLVELSTLLRFRYHEGIVLALGRLDPSEIQPVLWFAETLRVPTVIDACSGLREELDDIRLSHPSLLLEQKLPYHLVRIGDFSGDTPVQRELWARVAAHGQGVIFDISRAAARPLNGESHQVVGELEQVMKALGDVRQIGDVLTILPLSRQREAQLEELVHSRPEGNESLIFNLSQYATIAQSVTLGDADCLAAWNEHAQHHVPLHAVHDTTQSEGFAPLAEYLALSLDDAYSFYWARESLAGTELEALLPQLTEAHRVICVESESDSLEAKQVSSVDDLDELNDFAEGAAGMLALRLPC